MQPAVYILANRRYGTLYVGACKDLGRRIYQHRNEKGGSFSNRYKVHLLVWYEICDDFQSAFEQERVLKGWRRKWKIELIQKMNPSWEDLYPELF